MNPLERWNALSVDEAVSELLPSCGSRRWAEALVSKRPFADGDELRRQAVDVWRSLEPADWLEAFAHHPRIGERMAAKSDPRSLRMSEKEQSALRGSDVDALSEMAQGNREYEDRFGYIYIVCASGRSASELLAILRRRLSNGPAAELREAAGQQEAITDLRLGKWLES